MCFTCGDKWGREHQCKSAIQLHVVQEMINFMQTSEEVEEEFYDTETVAPAPHQLMMLSSVAINTGLTAPRTMQLQVQIQGNDFLFLVDSGSSTCFIDEGKCDAPKSVLCRF